MHSRYIDIPSEDGKQFKGYLTLPPTGSGPGIVLIQEIFGVNGHIRQVADQYAMDGFVVLAPDVFWRLEPGVDLGYDEQGFQKGLSLMQKMDFPMAIHDLASTVKALRGLPECKGKVASLGFCMGGLLSYLCAANAGVDAAVCYYPGSIDQQLDQAGKIQCPVLIHFAGKDHFIPQEAVAATRKAFAGRNDVRIEEYPGVDHGFNCWDRGSYDQRSAALAHGRSLQFLSDRIG
ncbi:MAG: dienelactone hydrolase family protein [Burkholderiaceae bacterium]